MDKVQILFVEDDADIAVVGTLSLKLDPRIDVEIACNGRAALESLHEMKRMPDLILLDIALPRMNGLDVMEQIALDPRLAEIKIVVMTSRVWTTDVAAYHRRNVLSVIAKPFDPLGLAPQLMRLLGVPCTNTASNRGQNEMRSH